MLDLQDISLLLPHHPEDLVLLGDISFQIPAGQFVAIVGPSGCGKSTLLKVIAGLKEQTGGKILWKGRDVEEEDLSPHEVGYIPQFSIAYENLTVRENLLSSLNLRLAGLRKPEREERVETLLRQVGLESIADRPVHVLSGGQRRRLALALELITSPDLLLCDEVTSGLDPKAEDEMVKLLRSLTEDRSRIVLSVTHSLAHLSLYDSIMVLYSGQLAYFGPPEYLTHYFQIDEPADLYPQLSLRKPAEWHRSWQKHRGAYDPLLLSKQRPSPADRVGNPENEAVFAEAAMEAASSLPVWEGIPLKLAEEPPASPLSDETGKNGKKEETADEPVSAETPLAEKEKPEGRLPSPFSQFFTLLERRFTLFLRDPSALWLQLGLLLGFPCLVVIFALHGLPQMENLSLAHVENFQELFRDNAAFTAKATEVGSLVSGLVMFQVILLTLIGSNNAAREIAGERLLFEKEKFSGVNATAYVASKGAFLAVLILVQSAWMTLFVKTVCKFPGDLLTQLGVLTLVNAAMTFVCLAISSFSRNAEQASLTSIYLVGFQLPLSGAVLALPDFLGTLTRPFIAAYWGWSGYVQTLLDTRFYDAVVVVSRTALSPLLLCLWILASHILLGLAVAIAGCRRSRWPD